MRVTGAPFVWRSEVTVAGCRQPFIFSLEGLYLHPHPPPPQSNSSQQELSLVIGPVTAHSEAIEQAGVMVSTSILEQIQEKGPQRSESRAGEETDWLETGARIDQLKEEEEVGMG